MGSNDSFRLIRAQTALQVICTFLFLAALYGMVGTWDHADALTAEAQAKLDRAKAIEAATFTLTHPIPYDAVVIQSGPGIEKVKARLYVSKSTKEAE